MSAPVMALESQRQREGWSEEAPALSADELYREYVVGIPMLAERAVAGEAEIGVARRLCAHETANFATGPHGLDR